MTATSSKPRALPPAELESLCQASADTDDGLTGTEIGRLLAQAGIVDNNVGMTKRKRLYIALARA